MVNLTAKFLTLILIFILIAPVSMTVNSPGNINKDSGSEQSSLPEDGETVNAGGVLNADSEEITSRSASTRAAFQLSLDGTLSLPEVYSNWTQNNWTGGSGQADWSNERMYDSGEDMDDSLENGRLQLAKDEIIEAWSWLGSGPAPRYRHSSVWDSTSKRLYVYGGFGSSGGAKDNLYIYTSATGAWSEKKNQSPGRVGHSAVWDSVNNQMLVFGGRNAQNVLYPDLLAYNPITDSWSQLNSSGPSARCYHSAVFDDTAGMMIVYGGYNGSWTDLLGDVWLYNVSADNWTQLNDSVKRAYHGVVWNPNDSLMYTHGGSLKWTSGAGHTYTGATHAYNWRTDTWFNKSNNVGRVRPIMVYDSTENRIVVFGGENDGLKNDTRFYYPDTDSWFTTINGMRARDHGTGVWDDLKNRLLFYGGIRWQTEYNSLWAYSPYTPAYGFNGSLVSSTFDLGSPVKFSKVSWVTSEIPPEVGSNPVRIQLAASTSSSGPWDFIGPDSTSATYFTSAAGHSLPAGFEGSRYIKYYINLSTVNMLFSPEFRSIRIDYFTYKPSETFDSDEVYDLGANPLKALHKVEWSSDEPADTSTNVYFRTAATTTAIQTASWEAVTSGQQVFSYKPAQFFEYRTVLTSTDPIATPVVNSLVFTFNRGPDPSTALNPMNESHWGSSTPEFTWTFQDPDGLSTDSQQAYSLQVSFLEDFIYLNYESGAVVTNISSCISNPITPDGWYYWRVKTQDNYGTWGAWSPVYRIYIDTTTPVPPAISSYTHPSEGTWYSRTTAIFDWDEASDISGIAGYSYALNQTVDTDPPEEIMLSADEFNLKKNEVIFTGLARFDGLGDGEWYFHLRAVDSLGHWGSTNTILFRVDHSPPTVVDLSDEEATTGEDLEFSFELDDEHSGLLSAELFWRYDVESVFQSELYNIVNEDTIYFKYPMKDIEADNIEYFLIVKDNAANESNAYRYPASGYAVIPLLDNDPPTILDTSGEFTQDLSKEMTIFIKAKDNIDVTSAKVYIAGEAAPREMTEVSNDAFELTINPVELNDLFKSGDVAEITYYFTLTDASNNNVTWPSASTFKISSSTGVGPDTNGEGKTVKETTGLSYPVAAGIIVVIVVVFLILLWFMLRRKEESMEEERSKFKLAMLQTDTEMPGVSPAPAVSGAASPEGEIAGMAGMPAKGLPPTTPQALPPGQMPPPGAPGTDFGPIDQEDLDEVETETEGVEELPEEDELEEPEEDTSDEDDDFSFKRPGSYDEETEE